ncbi:MAG: TIR domain-containing protein [Nitrosomonadales bacterium]|nr:TIR domain-containing protein [Nitrosomonadales bacterium]
MSGSNTKSIFISHTWSQNQQCWKKVVGWLESDPDFAWKNCSSPDTSALPDRTSKSLSEEITRQIASAQAVIILSEMYAANSDWIDYEISEAKRLRKFIIGVAPLEQGSIPHKIREASDLMVSGHSSSLLSMVKYIV